MALASPLLLRLNSDRSFVVERSPTPLAANPPPPVARGRHAPSPGSRRGTKAWHQEAADRLGRTADQCAALRRRIDAADPSETGYAIRCDLPVGNTESLLIVDQFEELLTKP